MSKKLEIIFISILVFVFPYMKIKIGETPLYFVDLFYLFLIFKYGFDIKKIVSGGKLILLYLFFSFFSFLVEFIDHFSIISIYFILRFSLPFYVFFYFFKRIKNTDEIHFLLKTIFWIAALNSLIVILYSISFTRPILNFLYANEFFYPQKERFIGEFVSDISQRGVTIAGGANSTSFLCLMGVAVFYYFKLSKFRSNSIIYKNELIGSFLFLFFSIASLFSMSRSAFITLFFVIVYNLKHKSVRLSIILAFIMSSIILVKTNVLHYINYSRISESISLVSGDESMGKSEIERVNAYTKPFEFLIKYPDMLVLGKGLSNQKVSKEYKNGFYREKIVGRHGFLGSIVYDRGFMAFIFFLAFIIKLYGTSFFRSKSEYAYFNKNLLLIIFFPIVTTHIFIDQINGIYQFAFLTALIMRLNKKTFNNSLH